MTSRHIYAVFFSFAVLGTSVGECQTVNPALTDSTPIKEVASGYDVVVVGAGTGGISAALQAARLGASVLLVEQTDWIGGQLAAAGVTSMDEGYPPRNRVRQRGIYREFCQRASAFYSALGKSTDTPAIAENHFGVEPHVARQIFYDMIHDTRKKILSDGRHAVLDLILNAQILEVLRTGNRVTGVTVQIKSGTSRVEGSIRSKILIDATEFGDIIPLAGLRYRVGIWKSDDDPSLHKEVPPVQPITWTAVIRKYPEGAPAELLLKEKPPEYGKINLSKILGESSSGTHSHPWNWERFLKYRAMPDSKSPYNAANFTGLLPTRTHINFGPNDQPCNVLDIEDSTQRDLTEYKARIRTLATIYYIQNEMGKKNWAVANDEGYNTPFNLAQIDKLIDEHPELASFRASLIHFPVIPYVRESRRIIGEYTLRARDIRRKKPDSPRRFPTAVAIGDYPVDVHGEHERRDLQFEPDLDQEEDLPLRWVQWGYGPFQIPFHSFIPEAIDGFLPAEKNISQSRIVSGATRLQPVTMLTGQAAGAIAGIACQLDVSPRQAPVVLVQKALLDGGSTLSLDYYDNINHGTEFWKSIQLASLYNIVNYPGRLFHKTMEVTPEEISQARLKIAQLKGIKHNINDNVLSSSKIEIKTRADLVRAVAKEMLTSHGMKTSFRSTTSGKTSEEVTPVGSHRAIPQSTDNNEEISLAVNTFCQLIRDRQMQDGAFRNCDANEKVHIIPYFGNLAAIALLGAHRDDPCPEDVERVLRWLMWYVSHQETDGTICDQKGTISKYSSTGGQDSTDSYAATYLMAIWHYWDAVNRDSQKLAPFAESIVLALQAIADVQDSDGLTWAKPGYKVKYLMDNLEVCVGLKYGVELFSAIGSRKHARQAQRMLDKCLIGLEKYRLPDKQYLGWAISEDASISQGLENFYPDLTANLMAIAFSSSPRNLAWSRFRSHKPRSLYEATWLLLAARRAGSKSDVAKLEREVTSRTSLLNSTSSLEKPTWALLALNNQQTFEINFKVR